MDYTMEQFIKKGPSFDETRRLRDILGLRALSKTGMRLGRVRQVRVDKEGNFRGILISPGIFRKRVFVSSSYIAGVEQGAVVLNIHPSFVFKWHNVLSLDGKRFGIVAKVSRNGDTNKVESFTVRRLFKSVEVPASEVEQQGKTIILKKNYAEAKKHFTK